MNGPFEEDRVFLRNISITGLVTGAVMLIVGIIAMRNGRAQVNRIAF